MKRVAEPVPPAVSGERFEFDSQAGRLSAYVAGQGPPLPGSAPRAGRGAWCRPLRTWSTVSSRV